MKIVVDAYAWIELFSGTSKGNFARRQMEQAESVITPDSVVGEVARKYLRDGIGEETTRERLSTILEVSELVCVDDQVAIEASKAYFQLLDKSRKEGSRKPSLSDGLVLGIAKINEAKVLTGDEHFKGLPDTIWISE